MDLSPDTVLLLSRIQFAFTVSFHIIFPAFTIGLSAFIATLLVQHLRTGREHYRTLARFWTKVFAVSFAMGVVSGIVLSYQFGTNWSRFSEVTGNVIGPVIGALVRYDGVVQDKVDNNEAPSRAVIGGRGTARRLAHKTQIL